MEINLRRLDRIESLAEDFPGIAILDPTEEPLPPFQWGMPTAHTAAVTVEAIRRAAELCLSGKAAAMVTGPIQKASLKRIGFPFPGHTEYLAHLSGAREFGMMFLGGRLKIMLTTIHEPLARVSTLLTVDGVTRSIRLAHRALREFFDSAVPRIGVAAFNPHAGEEGQMGEEEIQVVSPAIERARAQGIAAEGPIAADTLFRLLKEGTYEAAVALYHDQALIPLKLLAFGQGVNLTVGLPIIRTSVDHGTAYEIAGKGTADPGSLLEAIRVATEIIGIKEKKQAHGSDEPSIHRPELDGIH